MKYFKFTRRPNIGITPDYEAAGKKQPFPTYVLKTPYAEAVVRAGGLPFILPYSNATDIINIYLDRISGLLVTGGAFDIAPEYYGEVPQAGAGPFKGVRTGFELALLKGALQRHMPILGICGGMQLLNVACGGTLYQDIAKEVPDTQAHEQQHQRTQPQHHVHIASNTVLETCAGAGLLMVNSTHHQAVRRVGDGLIVTAHASDSIIEAIEENSQESFTVGVQWHPELLLDSVPQHYGLFRTFIIQARRRRSQIVQS